MQDNKFGLVEGREIQRIMVKYLNKNPIKYFFIPCVFLSMEQTTSLILSDMNRRSIGHTVKQYSSRLYNFIRGRVSTDEDAEDILQDVWFQLSRVSDLDSIQQMSAWLFSVARNRITDKYRKKSESSLENLGREDEEGFFEFSSLFASDSSTPAEEAEEKQYPELILDAVDALPEAQQEVFVLHEFEQLTLEEIAEKTGVNLKTVISRKRYAVQKLRENLRLIYQEINS